MRMLILILIIVLTSVSVLHAEQHTVNERAGVFCYRDGDDPLLYVRCVVPQPSQPQQHYYRPRAAIHPRPYLKHSDGRIQTLYPVTISAMGSEAADAEYLFRARFDEMADITLSVQFEQDGTRSLRLKLADKQVLNEAQGQKLKQQWRDSFKRQLIERIRNHEDHELEILLHWRFFGSVPRETYGSWKRDELLRFAYTISGLNDIEDAIPREQRDRLQSSQERVEKPEPILLPQVTVEGPVPDLTASVLSHYTPRSCYYIEWPDIRSMLHSSHFVADQFDQWSQGTYPQTSRAALRNILNQLQLSEEQLQQLQGVRSVAVAGWDPYIQSGTNLMLMLLSDQVLLSKKQFPHSKRLQRGDQHVLLIASCQRLIEMSAAAEHSLAQVDQFKMSRARLQAQDAEVEHAFCYLSDFWLTNYISPRWYILSARRRQVDARIRLACLLKEIHRAESGIERSLKELAAEDKMKQADLQWLLQDLEERDGVIVHSEIGGIGQHTPIDELPFDSITVHEKADYEDFRRLYTRRWRQMDPIAVQVVQAPDNLWKTRLYVSPISNRSDFRFLNQIFLKEKQTHEILEIDNIAAGISVKVATKMAMGMGMPLQLPAVIGAQLVSFDAAPSSYAPSSWLEAMPAHDWMSYMRMPAALIMPPVLFQQLGMMGGRLQNNPSEFEGLQVIDGMGMDGFYDLFAWQPVDGNYVAVGTNPIALLQMRRADKRQRETAATADIHLWFDAQKGYHMTRKLFQLAVKNRTLASWRRQNRILRIAMTLGDGKQGEAALVQRMAAGHYFPTAQLSASLQSQLPRERGLPGRTGYRYASASATRQFGDLPELFHMIKGINVFISVEDNALYFENHVRVYPMPGAEAEAAGAADNEQTGLDFEE